MKSFFEIGNKEKTEIRQKQQQKKEYKLIASAKHRKGMTLFSVNTVTGEIKPAEYQIEDTLPWEQALLISKGHGNTTRKVVIEKDCIYVEALNVKNLHKKLDIL